MKGTEARKLPKVRANKGYKFKDNLWYANSVKWAVNLKILSGTGNGLFEPNKATSRSEMAIIIAKYLKAKNIQLPDNENHMIFRDDDKILSWAKNHVYILVRYDILKGDKNGNFNPNKMLTRAEAAIILEKLIEKIEK